MKLKLKPIIKNLLQRDFYSTSEKIVGQWIDGSPIYRKTYTGTLSSSADNTAVTTDRNCNNTLLINAWGSITTTGSSITNIGNYLNSSWYNGVWLNTSTLFIYYSSNVRGQKYVLTIDYVKMS